MFVLELLPVERGNKRETKTMSEEEMRKNVLFLKKNVSYHHHHAKKLRETITEFQTKKEKIQKRWFHRLRNGDLEIEECETKIYQAAYSLLMLIFNASEDHFETEELQHAHNYGSETNKSTEPSTLHDNESDAFNDLEFDYSVSSSEYSSNSDIDSSSVSDLS